MRVIDLIKNPGLAILQAAEVLRHGGVLAFPTETTYGLGSDPRSQAALGKIYRIKGREPEKALPLVASSLVQVEEIFELPKQVKEIAEKYWPGPLTILLQPKDIMMRKSTAVYRDGYSAVRVTSHELLRRLIEEYGFPVTATSANASGEKAALSLDDINSEFGNLPGDLQPDLILDGGILSPSEPSTIIKVGADGGLEILRHGAIKL